MLQEITGDGLILNKPFYIAHANANIGIGQDDPQARLHVNGEIIIGQSGLTCEAAKTGAIRYNSSLQILELCNGSSWESISAATCADATPDSFNFTDSPNQSTSSLVTSNIVQISGILCSVNVEVSGEGSPQIRVCDNSTCSSVSTDWNTLAIIDNGQYLQTRLTSSSAGGDTYTAIIAAGNTADAWNVTPTGDCSSNPSYGTICADGTIYAGKSPDGNVDMYVMRCDAGLTWDGATCSGVASLLPWNDGNSNNTLTGIDSSITGEANTDALYAADASTDTGMQIHKAAEYCYNLSLHGQSDWYLPTTQEYNVIYTNIKNLGNFLTSGERYYTSREASQPYAYVYRMNDGSTPLRSKSENNYARCARK